MNTWINFSLNTQVEIVCFPDGSIKNPNNFKEFLVIKGSVPMMIKRTMQTSHDLVIEEMVTKVNYQMEAIRRFNIRIGHCRR